MNAPHLHLILNHVPTIGSAIALGLLLLGLLRRQEALTRVSLEVFFVHRAHHAAGVSQRSRHGHGAREDA